MEVASVPRLERPLPASRHIMAHATRFQPLGMFNDDIYSPIQSHPPNARSHRPISSTIDDSQSNEKSSFSSTRLLKYCQSTVCNIDATQSHPKVPYLPKTHRNDFPSPESPISSDDWKHSSRNAQQESSFGLFPIHWSWEIGSIAVSVISMVLIIAILFHVNEKPLEDWKLPIQPNSLLAVFSTLSKSALLVPVAECLSQLKWKHFEHPQSLRDLQVFDEASRGPWGSTKFFWKVKHKSILACVAAILTLLTLVFEPFAQQIIKYTSRDIVQNDVNGFVVAASAFHDPCGADPPMGNISIDTTIIGLATLDALSKLTSHFTKPTPEHDCPTQRCDIPAFVTLGACASCMQQDYDQLQGLDCQFSWNNGSDAGLNLSRTELERELTMAKRSPNLADIHSMCSLPELQDDDDWASTELHADICAPGKTMNMTWMDWNWTVSENDWSPSIPKNETLSLGRFAYFSVTTSGQSTLDSLSCKDTRTHIGHCQIEVCAQHYDAGSITHNIRSSGTPSAEQIIVTKNDSDILELVGTSQQVYHLDRTSIESFQGTIAQTAKAVMGISHSESRLTGQPKIQDFPQFVDAVSQHFDAISQSRRNANATNVTAPGYVSKVFVEVRWAWLILPLFMVLLAAITLAITIVQSHSQEHLYMSSILAVLFHGLDGGTVKELELESEKSLTRETRRTLEEKAGGTTAVFKPNGSGDLKFVRAG